MAGHPGYQLPDGDAYTDELACCLVFYPDKPEYRRALLGSLVYLSKWLAWERDSEKRGKDAARAWQNAVDETLECWNMACLEELISDVATIRTLMETKKDCCDSNVTYFPTEEPTTVIIPDVGDAPDYYGETAIADWAEWKQHVCFNAHAYVDYLKSTSYELMNAVNVSSIFLGLISSALVLLAFSGIGLPIAFGLAAAVVTGIALGATATTFSSTASDFENARDDIVCAILLGASLPDAIEDALSSGTDWDLFYQFVDYESAIAILYEGGWGAEYLPTETREDCVCEAAVLNLFEFPVDVDGFVLAGIGTTWVSPGQIACTPANTGLWKAGRCWEWSLLATRDGYSLPAFLDQVTFRFQFNPGSGSMGDWRFEVGIFGKDDIFEKSPEYNTTGYSVGDWHEITWNLSGPMESGNTNDAIWIRMYRGQPASAGQRVWIDDFALKLK